MSRERVGFVVVLCVLLVIYITFTLNLLPSYAEIRSARHMLASHVDAHPVLGISAFVLIYIIAVGLSLPIATPLAVLSGFLFGNIWGTVIVGGATTIGATAVFLFVRSFFRKSFEERFGGRLQFLHAELLNNGFRDLFLLRLAPLVPFSLLNVGAGLTKIRTIDYVLATLFGTLPFAFVYVLAGTRLSEIETLGDVVSFRTLAIVSFVVLAILAPLVFKRAKG